MIHIVFIHFFWRHIWFALVFCFVFLERLKKKKKKKPRALAPAAVELNIFKLFKKFYFFFFFFRNSTRCLPSIYWSGTLFWHDAKAHYFIVIVESSPSALIVKSDQINRSRINLIRTFSHVVHCCTLDQHLSISCHYTYAQVHSLGCTLDTVHLSLINCYVFVVRCSLQFVALYLWRFYTQWSWI